MNTKTTLVILAAVLMTLSMSAAAIPLNTANASGTHYLPNTAPSAPVIGGNLTIYANGTASNSSLVIHTPGSSTYTLRGNLSGNLTILASNVIVYGAGYWIGGASGITVRNVTAATLSGFSDIGNRAGTYLRAFAAGNLEVENSVIGNASYSSGVLIEDASNVTFTADTISGTSLQVYSAAHVSITADRLNGDSFNINEVQSLIVSGDTLTGYNSAFNVGEANTVLMNNITGKLSLGGTNNYFFEAYNVNSIVMEDMNVISTSRNQLGQDLFSDVSVKINNVTLDGFEEQYYYYISDFSANHYSQLNMTSNAGVELEYTNNVVLKNSVFTTVSTYGAGLNAYQDTNMTIYNLTAVAEYAIEVGTVTNLILVNSTGISAYGSYGDALYTYEILNGTVSGNTFFASASNSYGIYEDEFSYLSIMDNRIVANYSGHLNPGIYADYLTASTIEGNTFSYINGSDNFSTGIYLYEDLNVRVLDNRFAGNIPYGISDEFGTSNTIVNNTMDRARVGISLYYTIKDTVSNNHGIATAMEIAVNYSTANVITGNTFSGSNLAGLISYYSNDNTYVYNTLTGNGTTHLSAGIVIVNSTSEMLVGNTAAHFKYGTYLLFTNNATLSMNTFETGSVAMTLVYVNGLTIEGNTFAYYSSILQFNGSIVNTNVYHNNFLSYSSTWNTSAKNVSAIQNVRFDLGSSVGGNYWTGYTGSFTSGIGTSPYYVGYGLYDNNPLQNVWTNPTVTFIAGGLAAGTMWSVSIGSQMYQTTGTSIAVPVTNGSYGYLHYTVGGVAGYSTVTHSGTVYYSGSGLTVFLNFTQVKYSVTFSTSGLTSGTAASLVVGNSSYTVSGSLSLKLQNGTYTYISGQVSGYREQSTSGTFTVNGSSVSITLAYTPITYTVTFREVGLSGNFTWGVNLSGNAKNTTGSSVAFTLRAGTYAYSIVAPSGYTYTLKSNVTVSGNTTFEIAFSPSSSTHSSGLNSGDIVLAALGGVGAGVLAALIAIFVMPSVLKSLKKKKEE